MSLAVLCVVFERVVCAVIVEQQRLWKLLLVSGVLVPVPVFLYLIGCSFRAPICCAKLAGGQKCGGNHSLEHGLCLTKVSTHEWLWLMQLMLDSSRTAYLACLGHMLLTCLCCS